MIVWFMYTCKFTFILFYSVLFCSVLFFLLVHFFTNFIFVVILGLVITFQALLEMLAAGGLDQFDKTRLVRLALQVLGG